MPLLEPVYALFMSLTAECTVHSSNEESDQRRDRKAVAAIGRRRMHGRGSAWSARSERRLYKSPSHGSCVEDRPIIGA